MTSSAEILRARAIVKKDELEKEVKHLRGELSRLQENFLSAAEQYGSELAGRPDGEGNLVQRIKIIEEEINLLEKYLGGYIDISHECEYDLKIKIDKTAEDRKFYQERLDKIGKLKSLLE